MAFLNVVQARSKNFEKILQRKFMQAMLTNENSHWGMHISWAARDTLESRVHEMSQETVDLVASMNNPDLTRIFWARLSREQQDNLLRDSYVADALLSCWPSEVVLAEYERVFALCPQFHEYSNGVSKIANAIGTTKLMLEYGTRADVLQYKMSQNDWPQDNEKEFLEMIGPVLRARLRVPSNYLKKLIKMAVDGKVKLEVVHE
jgi:hypothetical protein